MTRNKPHIVLAALNDGTHVQVGGMSSREGAHALWSALDSEISGFSRDARGRLRTGAPADTHTINGQDVRFYRVRNVEPARLVSHGTQILAVDNITAEFGHVPMVDLRKVGKRAVR